MDLPDSSLRFKRPYCYKVKNISSLFSVTLKFDLLLIHFLEFDIMFHSLHSDQTLISTLRRCSAKFLHN